MATDRPRRGEESDADLGDDRVRDDDHERDFGEGDPPDPLGQAEPAVTEAHIAERAGRPAGRRAARPSPRTRRARGAPRPPGGGRSRRQRGPALQAGPNGEPKAEPEHRHSNEPAHPRKGLFGRAADFLRASYAELRRVQWPDRSQVGQGTAVTLGFVVVAGAYLGLLDAIWNPIIQAIL